MVERERERERGREGGREGERSTTENQCLLINFKTKKTLREKSCLVIERERGGEREGERERERDLQLKISVC